VRCSAFDHLLEQLRSVLRAEGEVDHVRAVALGVGYSVGDREDVTVAFRIQHPERHDLGLGCHEVHDPGYVCAVTQQPVLDAIPIGISTDRALRRVLVIVHEVVALDSVEVGLQSRVVELCAGVQDSHRSATAFAD
jgi:hypothetical protein